MYQQKMKPIGKYLCTYIYSSLLFSSAECIALIGDDTKLLFNELSGEGEGFNEVVVLGYLLNLKELP